MTFVAENFAKSSFEPVVDRDRGWAVTIGLLDRDNRKPISLYSINDLDLILPRDQQGRTIENPKQRATPLSAITAECTTRIASQTEMDRIPGLEKVVKYKFYSSVYTRENEPIAPTWNVPGCDWESSKAVYGEALCAWGEARKKKTANANKILLMFE
ncbi:hypothetical protein [Sphingorhabdus sp. EL138]|uniref:hypothetical protein n=1 Tax=Sphingorhabdus sp. EL138 TaxID=2073156 RepID=UPI000D68CC78|nr:hypothetical protein [Sphingorhabdus sp. EL138]